MTAKRPDDGAPDAGRAAGERQGVPGHGAPQRGVPRHGVPRDGGHDWEQRVAAVWAAMDEHEPEVFLDHVRALAAERSEGDAPALFELASAYDATGDDEAAVPLYRHALAAGLTGARRRRATIQLASTLRNLGQVDESVSLLVAEREIDPDELDPESVRLGDAVAAFLALALADTGREREAAGLALGALARHLPGYNRSVAAYATALSSSPPGSP